LDEEQLKFCFGEKMEKIPNSSCLLVIVIILSCAACSPPSIDGSQATQIAGEIYSEMTAEAFSEVEKEVIDTPTPEIKILFEDDFSGSTSPYDYKDSDIEIKQEDGKLFISIVNPTWMTYTTIPGYDYKDTTVDVDVMTIEGDPEDRYGVICRATNNSSYIFEISYDGYFGVWLWDEQDGYTPVMDWTRSSAIDTGLNKRNHISVTCNDDQLILYLQKNHRDLWTWF